MTRIPDTTTTVSYAYTIQAQGKNIGTLQGFTPSANRILERVRQIQDEERDTVEIVPGRSEFSVTIDRLETYNESMMEALGFTSFEDLSQVVAPFQIVEMVRAPDSRGGKIRRIFYQDCWIQSITKTIREGTTSVSESVTIQVTKIIVSGLN